MADAIAIGGTADGDDAIDRVRMDANDLGSDAIDSEWGVDAPSTQQIVDVLHTTACQREVRCGKQATVADCLASTLAPLTSQMMADLSAGTVTYDARAGQALLDWLANLPCGRSYQISTTAVATLQSLCAAAMRGTITTGGVCDVDDECAAGLVCGAAQNTVSNQAVCGAALHIPTGQSCPRASAATLAGPPCGTAAYCSVIVEPGNQICEPLPTASGQDCQMFEGTGCANGLVCLYVGNTVVGMCGTLPAVGEPCNGVSGCDDPTNYCDGTTCVAVLGLGAACDPEVGFPLSGNCAPNLFCDGTTCVARPGPDSACGICLGDLVCNQATNTCDFSRSPAVGPELPTCP